MLLTVTELRKKANTKNWLSRSGEVVKINLSMRFLGLWNLSSIGMCKRLEFGVRTDFRWCKESFVGRTLREWPWRTDRTQRETQAERAQLTRF